MSSDRVLDYLTEELVVEKNIVRVLCRLPQFHADRHATHTLFQVTYRSLSNALGIHVNEAKKCVLYFYNIRPTITYLQRTCILPLGARRFSRCRSRDLSH